jgi:hypothetical protein
MQITSSGWVAARRSKYFNFSNRSIIERSIFHGLSRADGERIETGEYQGRNTYRVIPM